MSVALRVAPPYEAEMDADVGDVTVPVAMENVVEVVPAGTVTDAGTIRTPGAVPG